MAPESRDPAPPNAGHTNRRPRRQRADRPVGRSQARARAGHPADHHVGRRRRVLADGPGHRRAPRGQQQARSRAARPRPVRPHPARRRPVARRGVHQPVAEPPASHRMTTGTHLWPRHHLQAPSPPLRLGWWTASDAPFSPATRDSPGTRSGARRRRGRRRTPVPSPVGARSTGTDAEIRSTGRNDARPFEQDGRRCVHRRAAPALLTSTTPATTAAAARAQPM